MSLPKTTNINQNFQNILTECINKEMNSNSNHNQVIPIPNIDHNAFIQLNRTQFCKLLKEQSSIAHGRGVKIHKAIRETLNSQTNDNNSNNYEIRLDSKLRDQLHWLRDNINDDQYTSELINECWNEMVNDDDIKEYKDNQDYQSKMAVMLFTMISDQRVSKTLNKLMNNKQNRLVNILYNKSTKASMNKDYDKAQLYLDQALTFAGDQKQDNEEDDISYKIFLKKSDCYLLDKQYQNALNFAQKCIELNSLSIKAHVNCGNALMEMKRFETAKEMFEKAKILAENNPNSAENIKLLQAEMPVTELMSPPRTNIHTYITPIISMLHN